MTCDDFQGQMLAGLDTDELGEHLATCEVCQAAASTLTVGAALLEDNAMWQTPDDGLEDRIVDMLVSNGAAGSDEPIPTEDSTLPARLHAVDDVAPTPTSTHRPNVWALIGVAAAIVIGFLVVSSSRSGPDWTVDVAGGPAAPEATAIVDGWNADGGTRVVLNSRGLEPAPEGFFYELWLSEGPLHISGGTFTGTEDIELWVAVSRRDFPRIWVTLEPIDEDESPSAEVVLDTGRGA